MENPLTISNSKINFSIVTISKNDFDGLKETVRSLLSQEYKNWELHIVLGNPTIEEFGYCEALKSSDSRVSFVRQNGSGIYNAMNQGMNLVNGKFLWFMNSGDSFFNERTLKQVEEIMANAEIDILIGGYEIKGLEQKVFTFSEIPISARRFSLNIRSGSHQATIYRIRDLETLRPFRTDFGIASDFDWLLRELLQKSGFRSSKIFASIEPGGVSDKKILQVLHEKQKARNDVFGKYSFDSFLGLLWSLGVLTKIYFRKIFLIKQK